MIKTHSTVPDNCDGHMNPWRGDEEYFCAGTTCIEHPVQVGTVAVTVKFHRVAWAISFAARVKEEVDVTVAQKGATVFFNAPILDFGFGKTADETVQHWSEVAGFHSSPDHPGHTNGVRNPASY